ncbi:MAG: PAS domain S-box protein, partial [Rhodospirillales bacterium]|nr:PAS domain S-box protein [Rhodospirillales bacterium]
TNDLGVILSWNESAKRLFGYRNREILGKSVTTLIPEQFRQAHLDGFKRVCDGGESKVIGKTVELRGLRKDGTEFPLDLSLTTWEAEGKMFFAATMRDITERIESEAQLRKLSLAVEQNPVSIVITDNNGKIEYVNPAFTGVSGYTFEEAIGNNPRMLNSGEHSKEFYENLWKTITSGKTWSGEMRNKNKNGEIYWESVSISPIQSTDGQITNFVAVKEDISERKQAEQATTLLKNAVETISEGFAIYDADDRLVICNAKYLDIYQLSSEFIAPGTTFEDILRLGIGNGQYPSAIGREDEWLEERIYHHRNPGNPIEQRLPNGRWLRVSEYKMPDGSVAGLRTDITELKNSEEAMKKAREEAENASRAKSDFLSSMSHELRTPMNAILGFAQMLEYNPKEPLTKTQKGCVDHVMRGGQHLLELINDVLDLAKIESGKVDLSIANVLAKTVLDDCLSLIQTIAEDRRIEIVVEEGFQTGKKVRTDQMRFKQSLLNIMSNAIKYNRENGKVTIDCRATSGGFLHVSVTDTGAGIPEKMLGGIFEPFNRLGAENTEIEGTGIGLAITKQLIERMDGRIGVDSEVGKGSTFWIELPLVERKLIDKAIANEETQNDRPNLLPELSGTILYVEDNPANLALMEMIIKRIEGLTLISAHNAELGIELAKSGSPDMIILDINLPGMNGFEALEKLQSLKQTKDIPVIALSANAMPRDIKRGIDAGFLSYLTKPIKVEEIANTIRDILES